MNKSFWFAILVVFSLLVFNPASAAVIDIVDGYHDVYSPTNVYPSFTIVVGGSEIFCFGLDFISPDHALELKVEVPSDFVGYLFATGSSKPDMTGIPYFTSALTAGESETFLIGGVGTSSPENPHTEYLGFMAPDMPPLTSLPVSSVPVPPAVWLFGSGLIGLIGVARRRGRDIV